MRGSRKTKKVGQERRGAERRQHKLPDQMFCETGGVKSARGPFSGFSGWAPRWWWWGSVFYSIITDLIKIKSGEEKKTPHGRKTICVRASGSITMKKRHPVVEEPIIDCFMDLTITNAVWPRLQLLFKALTYLLVELQTNHTPISLCVTVSEAFWAGLWQDH